MGPAESLPATETRRAARSALAPVVASHFLSTLGFSVFSLFPKYLMTERGMSQAETGPIMMGTPLGALLFSPLVTYAMGRHPKRAIVRASTLVFAALTTLVSLAPAPELLPLIALGVGGACMGVFNGGAGLVADATPQHGMARGLGIHGAAGMLGHALGPLLLEPLASTHGWATAFTLAALASGTAAALPLAAQAPAPGREEGARRPGVMRPLLRVLLVAAFAGIMHNALWTAHQPLVLARGGHEMRGYFVGMSAGAVCMRLVFGGLPDRLGHRRSTLAALAVYALAALGMTWVTPATLALFGLVHGLAHGVLYPAMAALATGKVAARERGEALTALYAAFNIGAALSSLGLASLGERFGPEAVFPAAAAVGGSGLVLLLSQRGGASARAA